MTDTPGPESAGSETTRTGVRAVTADSFSLADAVGGVRGLAESVAPGLVFVVAYVTTRDLMISIVASAGVAVLATVVRLLQRTPVTQAVGGLLGIVVGVIWAWTSGEAEDFYLPGLWTNAIYGVVLLVTVLIRWPAVGFVVEALRTGWSPDALKTEASDAPGATGPASGSDDDAPRDDAAGDDAADDDQPSPFAGLTAWRDDPAKVRRYSIATWLWVGMFALRLAVKVPLYFAGDVAWLGTFHLVLGVPLWALVLFLTWVVVRAPRTA
ncbi:DUF3159 domain-containing protein [Antribacter gilvus]|uniref:DUF3159 domain-containing protein n=1 Tax=Antribacter gilvus TaxID=2304675 RepID=UPI000F782EF2|nr:DUF3159 domain-containing protein [Antribacter gilvus]